MKTKLYSMLIRWYASNGKKLPSWLSNACEREVTLRVEFEDEIELSRQLKDDARGATLDPNASEELTKRILTSIGNEPQVEEVTRKKRSPSWTTPIAFAAAACVAGVFTLLMYNSSSDNQDLNTPEVATVVDSPSTFFASGLLEGSENWGNPLDREVENVLSDAKGAVGFLANNFLPSELSRELLDPDNGDA